MNIDHARDILLKHATQKILNRYFFLRDQHPELDLFQLFDKMYAFHKQVGFFNPNTKRNLHMLTVLLGRHIEAGPDEPHEFRYAGKRYKAAK